MFPLDPSDVVLLLDFALALFLALYFAVGHPRTWYRDRLGWVIFGYAVATVALLGLIVYGIVFSQRVHEALRLMVSSALAIALISKIRAVYSERRMGRVGSPTYAAVERNIMSTQNSQGEDAVKKATEIWYKAQRVLRTIVQTAIPAFLTFALVLPQIIEALGLPVDSELRLWLLGAAAIVTAVAGAISRVMAIPAVNAWLTKIGLGSVPKDAIYVSPATQSVHVKTDPKLVPRG